MKGMKPVPVLLGLPYVTIRMNLEDIMQNPIISQSQKDRHCTYMSCVCVYFYVSIHIRTYAHTYIHIYMKYLKTLKLIEVENRMMVTRG